MRHLATTAEREGLALKRTLIEIERKLTAIVRAIEDGGYNPTLKARLRALEQEKAQRKVRFRAGKPVPVVRLHTKLPELYRSKIERLAEALNAPETVTEAAEIMRGLIDRIVLTPDGDLLRAELHGDIAVLARFAQTKKEAGPNPAEIRAIIGGCGGAQPPLPNYSTVPGLRVISIFRSPKSARSRPAATHIPTGFKRDGKQLILNQRVQGSGKPVQLIRCTVRLMVKRGLDPWTR